MSKSPKPEGPSAAETASAQIAKSRYNDFKTKYAPLLKLRAAESQTDAVKTSLRGRAQADTMQALSKPSLAVAESPTAAGDMAEAVTGQLSKANTKAREYNNQVGLSVLARGNQQAATAQEGLATASRLSTSSALAKAQAKQDVATAKWNAVAEIGSKVIGQGMENYSQTGGFFTPGVQQPGTTPDGKPIYKSAQGPLGYLNAGISRNF